ncbi:MAG: hypothetical protein CMP10_08030 [Zetaproteobacteria bacterium]|nr:hypothetical protein [Pseudobdellovibrionaceae bacterium]|tara:strand:+ start:343 stop:1089 length:747 start_codon:yes stop_codon:yes gene_type:complete
MIKHYRTLLLLLLLSPSYFHSLYAGNLVKKFTFEIDPFAPASAIYEGQKEEVTASNFGGRLDFNIGGTFSMGPEFWSGAYVMKGAENKTELVRREDLWPNERHKISGIRARWNFTFWEVKSAMRGWFLKTGYSYTKIESRANRYTEHSADGNAIPSSANYGLPDDETDFINELRHDAVLGFGQRWFFWGKLTSTVEVTIAQSFKREVNVESKDPRAELDYTALADNIPFTKFSSKPYPELNFTMGYAF